MLTSYTKKHIFTRNVLFQKESRRHEEAFCITAQQARCATAVILIWNYSLSRLSVSKIILQFETRSPLYRSNPRRYILTICLRVSKVHKYPYYARRVVCAISWKKGIVCATYTSSAIRESTVFLLSASSHEREARTAVFLSEAFRSMFIL